MNSREQDPQENQPKNSWTPSQVAPLEADDDEINLSELVGIVRDGKWRIAVITAVILGLAILYAFLAPSTYQADALVQIQQQNQPSGPSADILSALLPIAAPADTEIDIMNSRAVLEPTVDKQHLNILIDTGGLSIIGHIFRGYDESSVSVTKLQVPDDWMDEQLQLTADGEGRYSLASPAGKKVLEGTVGQKETAEDGAVKIVVGKLDLPKGASVGITRIYDQEAIYALQKRLAASEQGQDTGVIRVTLEGHHPAQIRDVVNTLADEYMKQNVAAMATQAKQSLAFVNKQLPQLKKKLDDAQEKLTAYREKNGAVDLDKQAQAMLEELTTLESELTQINLAETSMAQRYTARYPGFRSLKNQERDIQSKIDSIHAQINQLPSQEQNYMELMRDVKVYEQLYTALLGKTQDLQLAEASTTGSARIVDYAVTPIIPVAPRKGVVIVLGLLLGLICGVLYVFLRRAMAQAVEDSAALEEAFGLPVFAVVPHSERQAYLIKRSKREPDNAIGVLATDDPQEPTVESLRSLRTSINFALKDSTRKIITLGGCAPNVGKSFLSINLAHVMAGERTRVLVIDGDMRLGHLDKYLGGRKEPGLSEVLSAQAKLEDAIYTSPHNQYVDFLPTGKYPPNPYDLVASAEMEALLDRCANEYDFVVLDVAPVLAVADGLILSRLATANFLVIKAGTQTLKEVRVALDRVRQNGVKMDGFVFNDLTRKSASYTYGRYGGAYQYYRKQPER